MNKKAQIKMFETIAILVIFFFLVGFGFIFYAKVNKTTTASKMTEVIEQKAIQISEKVAYLPETQCTFDNIPTDDCIDIEKIKAFSKTASENNQYYFSIFEFSRITVNEIPAGDNEPWLVYDNPKQDSDIINIQLPISIYDPIEDRYNFGSVKVEIYT